MYSELSPQDSYVITEKRKMLQQLKVLANTSRERERGREGRRGLTMEILRRSLSELRIYTDFYWKTVNSRNSPVIERSGSPPVTRETGVKFPTGEMEVIFYAFN